MKQTITIEVQLRSCDKCRSKAMKIAVAEDGVISVGFKGANRDQMVITGDGVDAAGLTKSLKKAFGYADLVSVQEITDKKPAEKENEAKPDKKTQHPKPSTCSHHPHQLEFYIHDPPTKSFCTIL